MSGQPFSYWRRQAAPIVARVLQECAGKSQAELSAALQAAYPFGERRYQPYKIWLDEIKVQTGAKPPADLRAQLGKERSKAGSSPRGIPDPRQGGLF